MAVLLPLAACDRGDEGPAQDHPSSTTASETASNAEEDAASRTYALGEFPPFPDEPLPGSTAEALQATLEAAVEDGTFIGVTAAVIVADRGSWAGAAGTADGIP